MPMVPEIVPLLYGCFKIGAIAAPIFSGFGVDATATRIEDAEYSVLFTGDGFYRRGSEVVPRHRLTRRSRRPATSSIPSSTTAWTPRSHTCLETTSETSGGLTPSVPSPMNTRRNHYPLPKNVCCCIRRGRRANPRG